MSTTLSEVRKYKEAKDAANVLCITLLSVSWQGHIKLMSIK